jgi:hypothetical protein
MKILKYSLSIFLVMLIVTSCQKNQLNPVSSTSISAATAFATAGRIASQVHGLYTSLKSGSYMGGRYLIYSDIRGENFINNTNNAFTGSTVWNFTVLGNDGNIDNMWNAAYSTINQVNVFLDGMQNGGDAIVSSDSAQQFHGEAKFVRAVAYYGILQLFAPPYTSDSTQKGLPLRLTPVISGGSSNLARSTVAEVYAQILSDLNDAEAELPSSYSDATTNTVHAHKNTAIAFKTRVYLSMGNYAQVISEANKIVSTTAPFKASTGVANTLQTNIADVFTNYTTTESIFSLPFNGTTENPGGQNQLGAYYLSPEGGGTGEYYLNPNGVVADANWSNSDARRRFIDTTTASGNQQWLTKFSAGPPYADWVPVLRYSEVLLNLAEAITRSTNTVDARAVALLNAVRNRSDASKTFTVADFANAAALVNSILEERNIELLGEGMRSSDIMRLGLTFPAIGSLRSAISPSSPGYVFPAPTSETQYNSLW